MSRRVVIVEDRAHRRRGHYPVAAIDLARGLCELDCTVELLTVHGWSLESTAGPQPFTVTRVGVLSRLLSDLAHRLEKEAYGASREWSTRARRVLKETYLLVRSASLGLAVRGAFGRHEGACDVISFAYDASPLYAAIFDGPGRILHHTTERPPSTGPPKTRYARFVDAAARRGEARRRAHGGGMRLAVGADVLLDEWGSRTPYLEPVLARHAARRDEARAPDAREALGIPADARVALVFGDTHPMKNLDVVWRAFAALPEWTLLVVGRVEAAYAAWFAAHGQPSAVTRPGFVDDRVRAQAMCAADVMVLSYAAGHIGESAVLQEAITFGLPVVCSEGTKPAEEVVRHRLGVVFPPGDPDALADAVRRAPRTIDPEDLAVARADSSAIAVAQVHLDAFDQIGRK